MCTVVNLQLFSQSLATTTRHVYEEKTKEEMKPNQTYAATVDEKAQAMEQVGV